MGCGKMQRRRFTKEFKLSVLRELENGKTASQICREHEIKDDLFSRWKRDYQRDPQHAFAGKGRPSKEAARNAELERKIGQLYLDNEFLKKAVTTLQAKLAETRAGV